MHDFKRAARQALLSGAAASILSALALAVCGHLENRRAAGPVNGPSQWIYGRRAAYVREPSLRHTLTGYVIHHVMATGWAWLHEWLFGARKARRSAAARMGSAAVTAAVANVVDFQLTPLRLRPGFEVQLSRKSLFVVYAAFAVGLALVAGDAARRPRDS